MKAIAYLVCFASAVAFAFAQEKKKSSPSAGSLTAADAAAIRLVHEAYRKSALDAKWSEWAGLLTADAIMMPPNGPAVTGRASIEAWARALPRFKEFQNPVAELEGAGDSAVMRGNFTLVLSTPGQPDQSDVGKFYVVWRKQSDGGWKFHRGIFNSDLPAPPAAYGGSGAVGDASRISSTITAAINAAIDATEKRDEACFASFSSAANVRFASQGTPLTLAEFKEGWRKGIEKSPRQEFLNRHIIVQVIAPDVAVSTMHANYRNFGPTGTASKTVPMVFTAVWKREGADWRIVDAHESSKSDWPTAQ